MRIAAECTTTPQALVSAILEGDCRQQADALERLAFAWSAAIERGNGLKPAIGLTDRTGIGSSALATAGCLRLIAAEIEAEVGPKPEAGPKPAAETIAVLEWAERAFGDLSSPRSSAAWDSEAAALARAQRDRISATIATLRGEAGA